MIENLNQIIPSLYPDVASIDWSYIIMNYGISDFIVADFKDVINWKSLSARHKLTEQFIKKYENYIIWSQAVFNPTLTYELLIANVEKFSQEDIRNYLRMNINKLHKSDEIKTLRVMVGATT